jgi:hypothetical protein
MLFGRISIKLADKALFNNNINWTLVLDVPSNVKRIMPRFI